MPGTWKVLENGSSPSSTFLFLPWRISTTSLVLREVRLGQGFPGRDDVGKWVAALQAQCLPRQANVLNQHSWLPPGLVGLFLGDREPALSNKLSGWGSGLKVGRPLEGLIHSERSNYASSRGLFTLKGLIMPGTWQASAIKTFSIKYWSWKCFLSDILKCQKPPGHIWLSLSR